MVLNSWVPQSDHQNLFLHACKNVFSSLCCSWNILSYLDDPQCALGILRYCLGTPKLVYSLRNNTPTRDLIDVLKVFNSSERDAFDQIIGTVPCDNAWKQSTLPINFSGLGVRHSQEQTEPHMWAQC